MSVIVTDQMGRELRVRCAPGDQIALEAVARTGTRVQRFVLTPLMAAYLADALHRMARELVVPVVRGTGGAS